jgi:NAD(P)-dependent dehydrogenase (short-subunit alcohol dehydrogenase family)
VREVFQTNVFGVIMVTNAMLPLLRRAAAARIVNVSSEVGSIAAMTDPGSPLAQMPAGLAYPSSKTALNMITALYAKELRDTPIKVNAANPGYTGRISTAIADSVRPRRARRSACGWPLWTLPAPPAPCGATRGAPKAPTAPSPGRDSHDHEDFTVCADCKVFVIMKFCGF